MIGVRARSFHSIQAAVAKRPTADPENDKTLLGMLWWWYDTSFCFCFSFGVLFLLPQTFCSFSHSSALPIEKMGQVSLQKAS